MLQDVVNSDTAARTAYEALTAAGGTVYVVGGAVRDMVLEKTPKDVDLLCRGLSGDQITEALEPLGRLDFTGKAFGVYRLRVGGSEVEIALPRTEVSTGSGHTDFQVTADPMLPVESDLSRRDFTGNAMAYDLNNNQLIDPFNGQDDLKNKNLRLVNENAFKDDPLRIVRALVANARFGLQPDESLIQSIKDNAPSIRNLPGERIQMELTKLLSGTDPASALQIAADTGLLDYIAPELSASVGFNQNNPHHDLDVYSHTMKVLKNISYLTSDPDLRLAALFHDSGKPASYSENPDKSWKDEDGNTRPRGNFYKRTLPDGSTVGDDHEDVSADLVREFMNRLRYPNKRIDRVVSLVKNHMFDYIENERQARRLLRTVGDPKTALDLLLIRQADSGGKKSGEISDEDSNAIAKSRQILQGVLEKENAFSIKDLAINGNDIMNAGVPAGPEIGQMLKNMLDTVIDHPELNTREDLMNMIPRKVGSSSNLKWKWSFDGNLSIWPVDDAGKPDHIDIFGTDIFKFAQGRVYIDPPDQDHPDGVMEILVWDDRGSRRLQDQGIKVVDNWLKQNEGRTADVVTFSGDDIQEVPEGDVYWGDPLEEDFKLYRHNDLTPEALAGYGAPTDHVNAYRDWLESSLYRH